MTERYIEQKLCTLIKALGGLCIKLPGWIMAGIPDRLILLPGGRALFVELKSPTGKLSLIQETVHKLLRKLGFRVSVISTAAQVHDFIASL